MVVCGCVGEVITVIILLLTFINTKLFPAQYQVEEMLQVKWTQLVQSIHCFFNCSGREGRTAKQLVNTNTSLKSG